MVRDSIWLALFRRRARYRRQSLPAVLGIALGVGVVVAVDLANQSVRRSFELSMAQIAGRSTHRIVGGPRGIDERFYTTLRLEHGLRKSAPVVEGVVRIGGESFRLLGLDPLAEAPFRAWMRVAQAGAGGELVGRGLLAGAGAVLMAAADARRLGVSRGDTVAILSAGIAEEIRVVGLVGAGGAGGAGGGGGDAAGNAPGGLLLADIATAQELLGRVGRLDRIDLILDDRELERAASLLPAGLRLVTPENRTRAVADLSKSFQTNLAALSLLALLVGGFLIYNAMSFSVLQRRSLLGLLRIIGVTRRQLFARILLEALLLGMAGATLGLLAGAWLGQSLVELVARTVNDLYFTSPVTGLLLLPQTLLKGLLLGLVVTLVAAFVPAVEAARAQPQAAMRRSVSERRTRGALPRLALAGAAVMLFGFALINIPGDTLLPGFAGLFCLIAGFCLATPLLVVGLSGVVGGLLRRGGGLVRRGGGLVRRGGGLSRRVAPGGGGGCGFGFIGWFAVRGIRAGLSRTGLAIAALTMAVAATIGIGVMVESFRGSVSEWLTRSLPGDVYLSIPASVSRGTATLLPDGLLERLREMGGIDALSTGRRVEVESGGGPVELLAIEMAPESYRGFGFVDEPTVDMWDEFHRGGVVLISEAYGFHHNLSAGDSVGLLGAFGEWEFTVGGVFRDYASDRGVLVMDRLVYAGLWGDDGVSSIGVYFDLVGAGGGVASGGSTASGGFRRRAGATHQIAGGGL